MKVSQGSIGRVFVIRLEDGDVLPECIERFAAEQKISVANALMVGGIGSGQAVVGPRVSEARPPDPMVVPVDGAHEAVAFGVLAPDEDGRAVLHIHAAMGRSGNTVTGCLRHGVKTWVVGEVILIEILGTEAKRLHDEATGFVLLQPEGE